MRRAFPIDVLACARCGGRMRVIGTVEDPVAVRQILRSRPAGRRSHECEVISAPASALEAGPASEPQRCPWPPGRHVPLLTWPARTRTVGPLWPEPASSAGSSGAENGLYVDYPLGSMSVSWNGQLRLCEEDET
jgi:hypothetical protein